MQKGISKKQRALIVISGAIDALSWAADKLGGITVWTCDHCECTADVYGTDLPPNGWMSYGDHEADARVWCSDECALQETDGEA